MSMTSPFFARRLRLLLGLAIAAALLGAPGIAGAWFMVGRLDIPVGFGTEAPDAGTVTIDGDRAFLVKPSDRPGFGAPAVFYTADVSDPRAPFTLGSVSIVAPPATFFGASELVVFGDIVYVFDFAITAIDVSDMSSPVVLPVAGPPVANQIAGDGARLYAVDDAALRIYDPGAAGALVELGSAPGGGDDLVVADGLAYVSGDGLHIYDVADPSTPALIGSLPGPAGARRLAVSQGTAFLTSFSETLVVDVSDPTQPATLATIDRPGFQSLAHGGRFYLSHNDGLTIYDVSNPSAPRLLREGIDRPAADLDVSGDLIVRAAVGFLNPIGTAFLDLRDLEEPPVVGSIVTEGGPTSVAVVGNTAYVATGTLGLETLDVTDRSAPTTLARLGDLGRTSRVAVDGDLAIVTSSLGTHLIDVSDPAVPARLSTVGSPGRRLAVTNGFAYVDSDNGVEVIDTRDPAAPAVIASVSVGARHGVAASGSLLLVSAFSDPLEIYDVSDPTAPQLRSTVAAARGDSVALEGDIALVGASRDVYLVAVGNPDAPVPLPTVRVGFPVIDLATSGTFAYAARSRAGISVIDYSSIFAPVVAGTMLPGTSPLGVEIEDGQLYVAIRDSSLEIVELTSPAEGVPIGTAPIGGTPHDIEVANGTAFVANGFGGTWAIDVGDVEAPRLLAIYPTGDTRSVELDGDVLYAGADDLVVLDVSDPAAAIELGSVPDARSPNDLELSGDRLYAARSTVDVYDIANPAAPTRFPLGSSRVGADSVAADGTWLYAATFMDLGFGNVTGSIDTVDMTTPGVSPVPRFRLQHTDLDRARRERAALRGSDPALRGLRPDRSHGAHPDWAIPPRRSPGNRRTRRSRLRHRPRAA